MTLISGRRIGTPDRNGLPERRNYRYQGTGKDEKPLSDAELEPYFVDYQQWLPAFPRPGVARESGGAQ